jgi:hypothetical protein
MNRARKFLLVAFILTTVFVGSALVANAAATLTSITLTCSSATASGTSTSPYATLYIFDDLGQVAYSTFVPVTNGTWSATVNFPQAPQGNLFLVRAWGTLAPYNDFSDPNFYDNEAFFEGYFLCDDTSAPPAPIVVMCSNPLPSDSVVYSVPAGAPAYFAPDLQSGTNFSLPAGTWKISEFKDDFAKVWIACEANPIWIPSSAVGGVIG